MADEKIKKIDYREVANNSLVMRGVLLETVYGSLVRKSEDEIQARIADIHKAMELVDRDTARTERIARSQESKRRANQILREEKVDGVIAPEDVSDEEKAKTMASLDELTLIGTQLENEAEMLEYFPRVKARVQAIEKAKRDAEKQDVLLTSAMAEAKEDLEAAEEAAKKAIENAEKAKQIDDEIAEIELEMEEAKAKGRKQKVIDAYLEEIEDKRGEKAELGTEEEWEEAMNGTKEQEDRIKSIKQDQKKTARVINKCSNPWSTILKGYGWVEIGDLTSDDLTQMIGVEVKNSKLDRYENNYEDREDKKEKDNKKEGKDGKGTKGGVMPRGGDYYIPPAPDKPDEEPNKPDEEPDKPEEEPNEPEHDDADSPDNPLPVKSWSEKHPRLAKMMPFLVKFMEEREAKKISKQERKELADKKVEEFVRKFREENKGEPSWWQKFKVRYFGEKDDDKKDPPAPPSGPDAQSSKTAKAMKIIINGGPEQAPAEPAPVEPDKDTPVAEVDKTRADILKEVTGLTLKEIQERKGAWSSKFSEKEIATFEKAAHTREQYAKENAARIEAEDRRKEALKARTSDTTFGGRRSAFREVYREGVKVPKAPVASARESSTEPTLAPADGPALPSGEAHGEGGR